MAAEVAPVVTTEADEVVMAAVAVVAQSVQCWWLGPVYSLAVSTVLTHLILYLT